MKLYFCPRCGYKTKIKTHMKNHLNRTNICKPILSDIDVKSDIEKILSNNYGDEKDDNVIIKNNLLENTQKSLKNHSKITQNPSKSLNITQNHVNPIKCMNFICQNCNKRYSRRDNLNRHRKTCIVSINNISDSCENKPYFTQSEVEELIKKRTEEYHKKQTQHEVIITELRTQIDLLIKNQGSNNVTYNTNIVLNAFGKENISYISNAYIQNLISSGPVSSIPKLLKHIHFNPDHCENHNIKIPNKKEAYAEIYNGKNWEISDRKQAIENMTDKAYSILNEHYTGGNDYMSQFKNQYDDQNKNLTRRLTKDTEMMILNSQKKLQI